MANASRPPDDPAFEALLDYIRANRGFDFTGYKRESLKRRFSKRMQALRIDGPEEYERYLADHPDEFIELFNTILINVTGFFRDAPAWDYLQKEVVPSIVEKKADDSLRIWSTGCASGEEAYTLAIVFAEILGIDGFRDRVKIYATDVDEEALTEGRHASYPVKRVEHLPEAIVKTYFERVEQHYVFRADLRRCVIFGRHDLVKDPPISKIDLLSSRNTLMYFTPDAQARILANFHFALQPDGYLFLGKSEVLLSRSTLFTPLDMKRRIFRPIASGVVRRLATPPTAHGAPTAAADEENALRDSSFEVSPVAQVIVDATGHLAQANQQARTLFKLEQRDIGRPLQDLELSYRPVELRSRIDQVHAERHAIALRNVEWLDGKGAEHIYDVTMTPLISQTVTPGAIRGVSIAFTEVTRYKVLQAELESSKREVETAYEELQSTVEELETTNEELQSTNEELETTNEELQSTNEELETMNEELQSTNEELETINDELGQRTDEINSVNAFLEAILTSIEGGVIVVDREFRVTAWNSGAEQLWGLRSEEAQGEHLLNLDIGLPTSELRVPLRKAMSDGGASSEVVVAATNRRGKKIRCKVLCSPLHLNGVTQGAILLMEDAGT
jgi:two-component system, chemotaxis family, CheB/CheR fusion protein